MSKVTLTDLANLQNENTAVSAINANNAAIETAFDNTLSRDGTNPNTMGSSLDMNSHQIINLPYPGTQESPVRLKDMIAANDGEATLPGGGTTGQALTKASNADYDATWTTSFGDMVKSVYDPTNVNADVFNSTNTKFTQTATGAVTRTVQNRLSEVFSVKDFGAVGNNVADDTTAIQNTINAAVASGGGIVRLPAGSYKTTTTLSISRGIQICGDGRLSSRILPSGYFTAIAANTSDPVIFRDFGIVFSGTATSAAAGIVISGVENFGSKFQGLYIFGAYTSIFFLTASYWVIDGCLIQNFVNVGVQVDNTINRDSGDTCIINTTILGSTPTVGTIFGVLYSGGGGLKISNTKINQVSYGVFMNYQGAATASDLIINGNSIEGLSMIAGVYLSRTTSTGQWIHVLVNNNQFLIGNPSGVGVQVPLDANGNWLSNLTVSNNQFYLPTGNPIGISINSTNGVNSLGNHFQSNSATTVCYNVGSSVVLGTVGLDSKYGTFAASVNSSGTVSAVTPF